MPIRATRFRILLMVFWCLILILQFVRVLGRAAEAHTLVVPIAVFWLSGILLLRGLAGRPLLTAAALVLAFPFVLVGLFVAGVWLAGAELPVPPSMIAMATRSARAFPVILGLVLGIHALALFECRESAWADVSERER